MNGAIPPNNNRNWLAHTESTSILETIHLNEDNFSVKAAHQRGEQTLLTNLAVCQSAQPNASSANQTIVLNALHLQNTTDCNNQKIKDNSSEACIELLTEEAWALNPELYKNNQQIDILECLRLAGEISSQIHNENAVHQGILVSYDGYSELKLIEFIKDKLDTSKHYIIRTGNTGTNGRHFAICHFDPFTGWFIEDKLFGLNQLTNITGSLTTFGRELLAPYASWGPCDEQHSIVFIDATPRRIAILCEYLLRYRYYGQTAAKIMMREFDRNTGAFTERPAHAQSRTFPSLLKVPNDAYNMQYVTAATKITASSLTYFVPYENRSTERSLAALAGNQERFDKDHHNALNSYPIDLVRALINAKELNPEGVFNPKKNRNDCYVEAPCSVTNILQQLDKSKPFFFRVGVNSGLGHYFALKYFDGGFAYPSGWYYYGRQNEMRSGNQAQPVGWFLLGDADGILTLEGNLICFPQNIIWGSGINDFSLQFIEATETRQNILQNYTNCLRYVSNKAAFAVLDQHAKALIREIAEEELVAEQMAINPQSVKFTSFLAQLDSEELLSDLSAIIEQEAPKQQSISQNSTSGDISVAKRQRHIALLNEAIKNPNETEIDRVKFTAIKMMLQNVSNHQIIKYCKESGTSNVSWNELKLRRMKEYYLHGGLLLLRGFSMANNSSPPSAKMMREFMHLLKSNLSSGSTRILNKLLSLAHLKAEMYEPPVQSVLDDFIKRCGYERKKLAASEYIWSFNSSLTQGISTENLSVLSSKDRQQLENQLEQQVSSNSKKRKIQYELTHQQRQRQETRKIRKTIDSSGIAVLSDEDRLKLQIDELAQAISSSEEKPSSKLKFKIVHSSLEGKSTDEIKNDCYKLAKMLQIKKIKVTGETIDSMVQHYKLGGLTLLKGCVLINMLAKEKGLDLGVKKYILDLIDNDPNSSISDIQGNMVALKIAKTLPKMSIPDHKVIQNFLSRCGYKWNGGLKKWE